MGAMRLSSSCVLWGCGAQQGEKWQQDTHVMLMMGWEMQGMVVETLGGAELLGGCRDACVLI